MKTETALAIKRWELPRKIFQKQLTMYGRVHEDCLRYEHADPRVYFGMDMNPRQHSVGMRPTPFPPKIPNDPLLFRPRHRLLPTCSIDTAYGQLSRWGRRWRGPRASGWVGIALEPRGIKRWEFEKILSMVLSSTKVEVCSLTMFAESRSRRKQDVSEGSGVSI